MRPEERVLVWLLLRREEALLLALRKPDRPPFAGRFVLPGEEMEPEESASETIGRVAREELDVRVTGEEFFDTLYVEDGGRPYAINVFRITSFEGRPRFRESGPYQDVRWGLPSDLQDPTLPIAEGLRGLRL